jgi:hypothetical protein
MYGANKTNGTNGEGVRSTTKMNITLSVVIEPR